MLRVVPYPLLLIAAIILDRVVISSSQIGSVQSLRSLFVLLLLTTLAIFLIKSITRDLHYTYFMVMMIWVMLLVYRYLYRLSKIKFSEQADSLGFLLILLLAMALALIVNKRLWRSIHNPARITSYFAIVFAVLVSFQVIRLTRSIYNLLMTQTHSETTAISELTDIGLKNETQPDIYVIVLDGYARHDVLRSLYQYDNAEFTGQLKKLGFFVADESHSNYVQTSYSMASFWNFDYLKPWNSSYDFSHYLLEPIQNNRAYHLLNEIGYTTVSFEGEVDYIEIKNSNKYLSRFHPFNKFESLLLVDSPLEPFNNTFNWAIPIPAYKTHIQRTQYELQTLKEIPTSIPGPKIVYAHMMAPHPPFVFDRDGKARPESKPYSLWDNTSYTGGLDEYKNGYVAQLIYMNGDVLDVVESILAGSETPPIILIMGDHGPASEFNWTLEAPKCVWERTSNLYAILLPGHQTDGTVYPSITPVNTFRVIFNTYFGANLPLLEDRSYMMSWQQPTLNIDITDIRDTREGCIIDSHEMPGEEN